MRAIVIDDEARARRILVALLEEHCPQVKVVDTVSDVPEAVKSIQKHQPDVIFLDIEMPGYTGFQLLDFFEKPSFEIIFTTAYSNYAIQAFQVSATDYLLKPIQIDQLEKAVEKVSKNKKEVFGQKMKVLQHNLKTTGTIKKIALPVAEGLLFLETENILYLKADGSYTYFYLTDRAPVLVSKKLKEFEVLLQQAQFYRPHRSYIIHLDRVKMYVRQDGGYITMENGDNISLSRDKKDEFLAAIGAR